LEAKMATTRRFLRDPAGSFFLFGPRGTGKSTWLNATLPNAIRVDLLDPESQRLYQARPIPVIPCGICLEQLV